MTVANGGAEEFSGDAPSMREDVFRLGRKSMAYILGHLATRAVSFLLLPLYTNVLAPSDYGILSLAFAFAAFALILYHFGLDSALLRYYTGEHRDRQQQVFSTVYPIQVAAALGLSLLLWVGRESLAPVILGVDRPDWMGILIGIICMDTVWILPMHILRAEGKAISYATLSLLNAVVTMTGNITLVAYYNLGITGALYANLTASTLLFLLTLPMVVRRLSLAKFSPGTLRAIMKFGLPFLPAGILTMIMELADRYLLRWLADMETVGLYSAGYKLGLLMLFLVMGFTMGWQPFFLRRGKQPNPHPIFARISTYVIAGLAWVLLVFSAWVDDLVHLPLGPITIFGPHYWPATSIVPVILLGYFFFGLYVLQLPGIHLTYRTRWVILFRASGAISNIALNILLIPRLGAMGAALATCLAFAVMSAVTYGINQRIYPVPYEWGRLARIGGLLIVGFILLYGLPQNIWRNLILTFLIPLGLWASRAATPEEKRYLTRLVKRS